MRKLLLVPLAVMAVAVFTMGAGGAASTTPLSFGEPIKGVVGSVHTIGTFSIPVGSCEASVVNNGSTREGTSVHFASATSGTIDGAELVSGPIPGKAQFQSNGSVTVSVTLGGYSLEDGITGAESLNGASVTCEAPPTTTVPSVTPPPVQRNVPPVDISTAIVVVRPGFTG